MNTPLLLMWLAFAPCHANATANQSTATPASFALCEYQSKLELQPRSTACFLGPGLATAHPTVSDNAILNTFAPQKQKPKVEWIKEPDTGVRFASSITSKSHESQMTLAGVAVRDKRMIILVNVYAYALYLDETSIDKHLQGYYSQKSKTLRTTQSFFDALNKDDITRTVKLQMVRTVGAKKIRNAFIDSVEPRIKLAAKKFAFQDGEKALATFRSYFGNEIKKHQTIEFTWLPGNKLVTSYAGKLMGTLESKALCWALWDTYFGKDPVEKTGKKNSVKRLTDRLSKTPKPQPNPKPAKEPKAKQD